MKTSTGDSIAGTQKQAVVPSFHIRRIYLKDFSLEQPNAPAILLNQDKEPKLTIDVRVQAKVLAETPLFEAIVIATVQSKIEDKTLFLIEAHQAGIFELNNIAEQQISSVLGVTCPHILYPYLRANVADAVNKAGFSALHLEEINFQALYQQEMASRGNIEKIPSLSQGTAK